MLFSAIGSLGDRLDSKFITAYFFPAFVAVLGTIWILVVSVGGERFGERIAELDSVEQGVGIAVILLVTMMLAPMLSALARPIATFYAGRAFPAPVREWSIRGQLCYRAAVTQATDLARNIWVPFDLYRFSILEQLREQEPGNLDEERVLWQRLAERLHELVPCQATFATSAA